MDFNGPIEAALSTDLRGEPYNFSLWDIHTGTQLVVFKGNKSNPMSKCLQMIDNNYFITATDNMLNVWSIFNKKCQEQKIFLPSRPSVICISPCAKYLLAGISEMIYVWQMCSGNLLAHTQRHYQTVSVLKMNQDGTFLFSGGEDGVVLVWPYADLISHTHNTGALNLNASRRDVGVNEPRFVWQHHSAQVTDIHITNGGRCITVSTDCLINLYSYVKGDRLYSVCMPSPLWSVVMNENETSIFMGSQDGSIYEIPVSSLSLAQINVRKKDGDSLRTPMFVGHKGKVSSLILSLDGTKLISASNDSSCKIWDLYQRKLLQDIKHQAPLANLTRILVPDGLALTSMTQSHTAPPLMIKPLKRNVYKPPRDTTLMDVDLFEESSATIVYVKNKRNLWDADSHAENEASVSGLMEIRQKQQPPLPITNGIPSVKNSQGESFKDLKDKLKDLYLLSAEKIFQDAASESLKPYKPIVDKILDEKKTKGVSKKKKANGKASVNSNNSSGNKQKKVKKR